MQNVQVKQNVNAANFLLVSSKAGNSVSAKEETEASVSFATVLQNASEQKTTSNSVNFKDSQSDRQVSSKNDVFKDDTSISDDKVVGNEKKDELKKMDESSKSNDLEGEKTVVDSKETSESDSVDSESMESIDKEEIVNGIEGLENISDEDMATILETIGNLIAGIMQQFDISLEEFAVKLEEFGMEPADLMTQQGLKEFFLQMNNAEVSDLIVDENLNQELQSFLLEMSDEIATLDTLVPDMESFVSNEEIARMFSELTVSDNEAMDVQPIVDADEKQILHDEPEVIVDNDNPDNLEYANNIDKSVDSSDLSGSSDSSDLSESKHQQLGDSSGQLTSQESASTETTTAKQDTFVNPILQAIQDAMNNVEMTGVSDQQVQQTDILRQVVEQVRLNMNQQQTSLELQLYPEHLGRIQINVVAKEGVMTASIVAETEAAKQAIEAGLLNLREAMDQQELKVEAIEVMVSTMGFESDGEQQSFDEKGSSNPRRKIDLSELGDEVSQEDEAEVEKMKASGSSVSYRA